MHMCYALCLSISFLLYPVSLRAIETIALETVQENEIVRGACALTRSPFQALPLKSDKQAYEYCRTHKKSFVAIVWPIAQGKSKAIAHIFKKYGKVLYYKKSQLNTKKASYLLEKAHPHITDMHQHVAWYFPDDTFEKPARVFVVEFENPEIAVACKMAIRGLYHLQYRAIHINDTHAETMELAEFFFT